MHIARCPFIVLSSVSVLALGACLDDANRGNSEARVDATSDASGDTIGDTADDTADSGTPDTEPVDTAEVGPETTDTAEPETVQPLCGDQVLSAPEQCDDGNACAGDGCGDCRSESTLVLTRLSLAATAGFDLDDRDGDHDITTGIDNRLASSAAVASQLDRYVADLIASAAIIQLATLSGLDDFANDPTLDLVLHPGVDPQCRASGPYPWLAAAGAELQSEAFPGCVPPGIVRAGDHPDNGLVDGHLVAAAATISLALGTLGTFPIARARLEADLVVDAGGISALHGTLGGVLPAAALYRIDLSALLPNCPTALHAVLGLAGHLDQDANGDGQIDFIRWTTTANTTPCLTGPVVISSCCIGGDCSDPANIIAGHDCPLEPRVTDGYSVGFEVDANAVRITNTNAAACEP